MRRFGTSKRRIGTSKRRFGTSKRRFATVEEAKLPERCDHTLHFIRVRAEPELFLRPAHDASDVTLTIHRACERILDFEEPIDGVAVRVHHVDERGVAVFDRLGNEILSEPRTLELHAN